VVVGGDDQATTLGYPFPADDDDPAVEQPQQKADQPPDEAISERAAARLD